MSVAGASPDHPVADISPLSVDFGDLAPGEVREVRFEVRNRGGSTLILQEVDPVCACTVASYDEAIEPGGTGEIHAKLDTRGLSGHLRRGLTVVTNDPTNRMLFLELLANVVPGVDVFPTDDVRLGNYRSLSRRAVVLLRREPSQDEGELVVEDVVCTSDAVRVLPEKLEAPRVLAGGLPRGEPGDWLLHLELLPFAPVGSARHEIRLRTGLARVPELTVPVWTQVLPAATFTEEVLVLTGDSPGRAPRGVVQGVLRRGHDAEPVRLESSPPVLELRLEWSGPRQFTLEAVVAEGASGGDVDAGTVLLRVGEETASLPFRIVLGS